MNIEQLIPNKPKQKRSLERYEKILDTVEKILLSDGVHAISIQEVSKAANMKRPTLYKLFPSNEALFMVYLRGIWRILIAYIKRILRLQ